MNKYDDRAVHLQQMTRASESQSDTEYDDTTVGRAAMHTREDIVLLVSYLSSVNEQLVWVRCALFVIAALLLLSLFLR